MLTTSARLLRLLTLLPTRPEWAGPELAGRLEVTERTLRRDMTRLRDLGYPVAASRGVGGGYRLTAGTALPPLALDDEEAVALVLSLRSATGLAEPAQRTLAKLERILPARLRRRARAVGAATEALPNPAAAIDGELLAILAEACEHHERLGFGYRDHGGTLTERTVEPHRIVHSGRRWYLVARDLDRDDWRTFRADRISGPRGTGVRFTPVDPPDAAAYVADSITSGPYRHQATIQVYAPAAAVAAKVPPTVAVVEDVDGRSCLLRIGADSLGLIALHMALLGPAFRVLGPPELVAEMTLLADRLQDGVNRSRIPTEDVGNS
ncbi:helix-turn-helix transcriptional regulator [Hamadaea tsunoensis]|uniref:helix-turn-helix transcriptional regulator n=1 Tax=Hamadaea tsunoensis TaxID=53368 RepID=UPI0003F75BF3|nr:YafY family protein [Hamadaea tsunoensis]